MFFTNSSGRYQLYKTWKGNATYAATPGWSRPIEPDQNEPLAPYGKPNPIKHWRKQLDPYSNTSKTGATIPFDDQVQLSVGVSADCDDLDGPGNKYSKYKKHCFPDGKYEIGPNGSRVYFM